MGHNLISAVIFVVWFLKELNSRYLDAERRNVSTSNRGLVAVIWICA